MLSLINNKDVQRYSWYLSSPSCHFLDLERGLYQAQLAFDCVVVTLPRHEPTKKETAFKIIKDPWSRK